MIEKIWKQYRQYPFGVAALLIVALFVIVGVYAPFFASSKPFLVKYEGHYYSPFFRYLFYPGFFTKPLDLFFNLLMFTLPLLFFSKKRVWAFGIVILQCGLFLYLLLNPVKDPAFNREGNPYVELNVLLKANQYNEQQATFLKYIPEVELEKLLPPNTVKWTREEKPKLTIILSPLIRPYHWEEDTLGNSKINRELPFFERTRINHKDLTAALIFGVRVSLVVGVLAVMLSLTIGIPLGAFAGYFAGKVDLIISRLLEVWEAMPAFFMLLLIVAVSRSKSIFIVISVIGLFGWTGIARFLRGEMLKQRTLPYAEACHSLGFRSMYIIFSHLLPNAIAPVLTLLPFAVMGAITSEAALSFLGLGEEGSTSWGVLMDEGRSAFPGESYLLWPPALLLTILLIAIAIVGDTLRDALDPKLRK